MTPFKNQTNMISSIVADLKMLDHESHKRSWNLVVPPGFYPGPFAHSLNEEVKRSLPRARLAFVSADEVSSPRDFMILIHYAWLGHVPKEVSTELPPKLLFAQLLDSAGPSVNILIISEFHKILAGMDERILVALRDAEQSGRIHTVAISIYPHKWLKEMWKKEGQLLHVSNYGDHRRIDVEPYSIDDIRSVLIEQNVSETLVTKIYEWTGGFPEAVDAVLEKWTGMGCPELKPDVQDNLRHAAEDSLQRLAKFIDPEGSTRFSDLIIAIHQHTNVNEGYEQVRRFHPWSKLLLDEDGLRVDALGDVLTMAEMERAFKGGRIHENAASGADLAASYYKRHQYDLCVDVLERFRKAYDTPQLHLMELHAEIMQSLRGGMSETNYPDADTQWQRVLTTIIKARDVMPTAIADERCRTLLLERYDQIEGLGKIVTAASKDGQPRFLDRIGGLPQGAEDRNTAFTLLVFQAEAAKSIRGNAAACKAVIELPEQLIRLWGWWTYRLNYYRASEFDANTWQAVLDNWPSYRQNKPKALTPDTEFPSLYLFCYCLYALQLQGDRRRIWNSTEELEKELSLLDTRNDIAHATVHMNARIRARLFILIDTWLQRLGQGCMESVTPESVMSLIAPLDIP